jgi:cell division protein FtsB
MYRPISSRQQETPLTGVRGSLHRAYEQRRRGATVAAAVLALGMGFHVVFGQNGITAYEQKRHDARVLQEQLKRLQDENQRLQGHVERLQDDPGAIEHQAREELHYTRPGEVIVTLPNEAASTSVKLDSK